jgi:Zn-dependent M28 family amino/carboxypeptidase
VTFLTRRRRALTVLAASALVASVPLAGPAASADKADRRDRPDRAERAVADATKSVKLKALLKHADRLQAIADANGDNRASGLPGYDASADYVADRLRRAGYRVTVQPFDFPYFEEFGSSFSKEVPQPRTDYVDGEQYDLMDYSGAGDVTAGVVGVDLALTPPRASSSGCETSDFLDATGASTVTGKIALVQRGTCSFGQKVANAEAAGAIGAVVMNQGNGDPVANADRYELFAGTLGGPVGIPAVSVSYFLGEELANTAGLELRIAADTISTIRSTSNVLADSRRGRTDNVVMAGAHLDSEPDTAGINDNGSGSIALLELALQMKSKRTPNALRFAWWGAEEAGLQGSNFYVNNLTPAQRADIALYLNFDMVASPNYTFGVYDGDDSAQEGSGPGPAGSAAIEDVFEDFFADRGEATKASDFTGRSDYGPFIAVGIPAGGLFTGAETIKTPADVALWGGLAGEQMDVCYHDPCDSLTPEQDNAPAGVHDALEATGYDLYGNLNTYAFDVNADAIATAVVTLAYDTSAVNGDAGATTFASAKAAGAGGRDVHGHARR